MSGQPTPQIDVLEKLKKVFTLEQLQYIADRCEDVSLKAGWGDVRITFDNGRADVIGWTITRKLPRRTEF